MRGVSALLGIGSAHEGDILGSEEQWRWLEGELTNSSAAAHLIVSSVQVLTSSPIFESWGHFPHSRTRLLSLLEHARPAGALLLSGDVHFAELSGGRRAGLLEATSSGLTHSCHDGLIGRVLCAPTLSLFAGHRLTASTPGDRGAPGGPSPAPPARNLYAYVNFGAVEVRWPRKEGAASDLADEGAPSSSSGAADGMEPSSHGSLTVRVYDVNGAVQIEHSLRLGLPPEAEGARWTKALDGDVPTIFSAAARLRLPIAGALLLLCLIAIGFTQRGRQRAERRRRRALKKAA